MRLFKSKNGISATERELAKVAEQRTALADRLNAAEIGVAAARRRAETLTGALTDIDRTAAELQTKLAQERDKRERERVAKELETMSTAIDEAGRATNCALAELVNVLAGVSEVVVEGDQAVVVRRVAANQENGLCPRNIFQGELSLEQLFFLRHAPGYARFRTPIKNLYMCGSATHPGGGIMGAPGRLAALEMLKDSKGAA